MIRLAAVLVAPVVAVAATLVWGPDVLGGQDGLSISTITDEAPLAAPYAADALEPATAEAAPAPPSHRRPASDASRARGRKAVAPGDPLRVRIRSLSPATIPQRGRITIRGSVVNNSDERWDLPKVYPLTSATPMTTVAELREAVELDPMVAVGERITEEGTFDVLPDLAPGERARFRIRVPRDLLDVGEEPGVYWIGAQVLATDEAGGREPLAEGRDRMFIPLLRRNADPVQTSLVVPLRGSTMRDDGALSDPERWAEELTTGGRLANLVSFVDSADPGSVTWLVDPAVIDAARRLADGNPGRNIRPTKQPTDQGEADEEADGDAGGSTGGESDAELDPGAQAAADWLGDLPDSLFRQAVLSLPYGDLDVAAAAQYLPSLYERARALSDRTLAGLDVQSAPAIAPPSGHINETGLQLVSDAELLLSEEALPEDLLDDAGPPAAVTTSGRLARMYDPEISAAASGRTATLPLRQRILAEAAVRSLAGGTRQLLVSLPYDFDPGSGGPGFFEGLDQDFVSLVGVDPATEEDVPDVEQLVYTQFQAERELDQTGFDVVSELIRAGESLDRLLPENDQIARDLLAEALSTTSYLVRDVPLSATFDATDALDWVRSLLEKVTIEAPEFVILSARSGPFAVTVDNGLDQPVSLQIRYTRNSQLVIRAPDEIVLPADSQQAVNLEARARSIGVHSVRLLVTDDKGRPLGDEVEVSIRSNQVGRIIWVVMGAGVGILFLAIAVRLVRRVRGARAA